MNLEHLKRKIGAAEDLFSLVKTMKALSAVSIRQYQGAVRSLSRFDDALEKAFQVVLSPGYQPHSEPGKLALIVIGTDQGMCGPFNERLATFIKENLEEEPSLVLVLGSRIVSYLPWTPQRVVLMPTGVSGITPTVKETLVDLEDNRKKKHIERVVIFYNAPSEVGASYQSKRAQLLPISAEWLQELQQRKWKNRCLPTFEGEQTRVASHLIQLWLFVSLYSTLAGSLAAENSARLMAMQTAEKNIDQRLGELRAEFNRQRQSLITSELLDVVSGFEAITGE